MMPTVSVVMATYNGEKYIETQLASIRSQTHQPDEVLICDDGSTDATVALVAAFIDRYQLHNWTVEVNPHNLGWKRNFWQGLNRASGDFIFPCDQDDAWVETKIAAQLTIMLAHPDMMLLASSYTPFQDGETPPVIAQTIGGVTPIGLHALLEVTRPGCSFEIRKALLTQANVVWTPDQPYDFTLWNCAILSRSGYLFQRSLIRWRVHTDSADFNAVRSFGQLVGHPVRTYNLAYRRKLAFLTFNCRFLQNVRNRLTASWQPILAPQLDLLEKRRQYLMTFDQRLWRQTYRTYRPLIKRRQRWQDRYFFLGQWLYRCD